MKSRRNVYTVQTYFEDAQGLEQDITCEVRVSPPEPDVNWAGDIDLESVKLGGVNIIDALTEVEFDTIQERCDEELYKMAEDYDA